MAFTKIFPLLFIDPANTKLPIEISIGATSPVRNELLTEVSAIYQDETRLRETLTTLYQQTKSYAETYGALTKEKGKAKGKSSS